MVAIKKELTHEALVRRSNNMKTINRIILASLGVMVMIAGTGCKKEETGLDEARKNTLATIEKVTDYEDLNIYKMTVLYDYNLDNLTPTEPVDTQGAMDLVFSEALPGIDIDYTAPKYGGCSVFTLEDSDGTLRFGRNYDFKYDSSAMVVFCNPKDGYSSVAHAALSHIYVNDVFESETSTMACLTAPFICLDGINEKGVGISVLTLDSEPVAQDTGKPKLMTTVLIRLVLDKAASTEEAVKLLEKYDMYATSGRDYHFYITDITGDNRIVEFDCHSEEREMVVTKTNIATNFYIKYIDQTLPNQKNGIYGHVCERYDAIEQVFAANNNIGGNDIAWQALKAASQLPSETDVTSNTQWSIVYNLNELNYEIVLHRRWDEVYQFELKQD